jgi:hypothetical protein
LDEWGVLSKAEKDTLAAPLGYLSKHDAEDVVTRGTVGGIDEQMRHFPAAGVGSRPYGDNCRYIAVV